MPTEPAARDVVVTGVRIDFWEMVELAFQGLVALLVAGLVVGICLGFFGLVVMLVIAAAG